jgi:cell pole-organizing protein PopZ
MSDSSTSQHEPTMEEILASIRKIISEDSPEAHAAESSPAGAHAVQESEVLELTQEAHDEHPPTTNVVAPASSHSAHQDDRSDRTGHQTGSEASNRDEATTGAHPGDGIFSDRSRKALDDALAQLSPQRTGEAARGSPAPVSGLPLEAVFERAVSDAFGPVLREWLGDNAETIIERMKPAIGEWRDEHFPAMLEDAVRAELARAIRTRGRR